VIAKMGSAVALFVIGYAVLKILPQLFDLIDGLVSLSRFRLKDIIDKIAGNR
jgi:exosortase/archaeosortase